MIRRIYNLLPRKEQKTTFWVALSVFVRAILDFVGIAALLPVLVIILGDKPQKGLALLLCAAVLVFIVIKNALNLGLTRYQTVYLLRLYKYFSHKLFYSYYHRGLLFLKEKSSAQLASEVNFICYAFSLNILQPIFTLIGSGMLIIIMVIALLVFALVPGLLLCLAFVPLVAVYLHFIKKRVRQYGEEEIAARREQARTVIEAFRGYSELEINNAYSLLEKSFLSGLDTINHSRLRMQLIQSVPVVLSESAIVIGIAMLLLFGDGDLKIISGVFALAAFRLIPAVRSMMSCLTVIRNYSHCIDIIADGVTDVCKDQTAQPQKVTFQREIQLTHLGFSFPDGGVIIKDLSLSITKGERVGIRGASGAGKSTLFNLMLGFYPATEGQILIDGKMLQPTMLKEWHRLVGYVPQEIFIAKGDVARNIALGQDDIDEQRIYEVLQQVQLKEWVDALPQGIHTPLGEYGNRMSGGQKQRIGIARALYKQAEVLFFDEATSSLDNKTEKEVNDAILQLSEQHRELTLIIIAHRESSLKLCTKIIDLER